MSAQLEKEIKETQGSDNTTTSDNTTSSEKTTTSDNTTSSEKTKSDSDVSLVDNLMNNIMSSNINENEILNGLNNLKEMQEKLELKLQYERRKKEEENFKKTTPEEYILKNRMLYKKIANKMSQFDGIINSKLPESNKDGEKSPMSGLTCKEAYNKQLKDIKENYEKYLKEKTGKTIEEYHPEGKFDPEQVIQVGYFPIYYF